MIKGLILSIQFLTRIPLKIEIEMDDKNISKSMFFFPFVGMLIGAISSAAYFIGYFAGVEVASLFCTAALIIATGGIHIDGLSDTCDGFYSSRNRARILEIMKDSRTGTFGVIAIVLDILAKYVLISNINAEMVLACLVISCANARLCAVMLMCFTKTARSEGLGYMFSKTKNKKYFFAGFLLYAVIISAVFNPIYAVTLAAALIASILIAWKSYKTIGGLTGDVYGASIEICEIVSLILFCVVIRWI